MIKNRQLFYIIFIVFVSSIVVFSQNTKTKVYVDKGILKWSDSQQEVALFGVNYSTPFAHSYRSIKKLGLSHKQAIDLDVAQLARLELEAYRIHVWDREVSDSLGNLLKNDHLDLLDYLIYKLKEKNIYVLLTPIAWWGTGWPEPDPATPGFSSRNSKSELITRPAARAAQRNYLIQFLNHKNVYTGLSYKDDPDIIGFEIINEPSHPSDTAMVTTYINEMAAIIRSQDVEKPIYYNISQNWSDDQAAAVYRANIDGISFQWYPTGLVKNSALIGNYLAHVDHYPVPEINDPKFRNKTRMVYEFDAADIAQSVMYPAMARSFREAGMQWASMFCYDPSFLAAYNTEYNTHYVNLLYTPQKAIGLMIAANVFRTLKTNQKFPSYPENTSFNGFRISYENNLSELNNGKKFYYSNSTDSKPKDIKKLQHIAGYGSSVIVKTDAQGAYFFDRIDDDIWRLELYPDVARLMNPFGRNSLDNKVRVLLDNTSSMTLDLPGLDRSFYVRSLDNNGASFKAKRGFISIKPGVYILSDDEIESPQELDFSYRNLSLTNFSFYAYDKFDQQVINQGPQQIFENQSWKPSFQVVSNTPVDTAILYIRQPGWRGFRAVGLKDAGKNNFSTEIKDNIRNGTLEYCISVKTKDGEISYPAKINKNPMDWDYYAGQFWNLKILPEDAGIILFDPSADRENIIFSNFWGKFRMQSSMVWDKQQIPWYNMQMFDFQSEIDDFTIQIELDDKLDNIRLADYKKVEFDIDSKISSVNKVKVQLIYSDYQVVEKEIVLPADNNTLQIPLTEASPKEFVLLPRPYPHFLPYYFKAAAEKKTKTEKKLNFIQITIPFEKKMESGERLTLQIGSIRLVKE
jgi:hypothetical protein